MNHKILSDYLNLILVDINFSCLYTIFFFYSAALYQVKTHGSKQKRKTGTEYLLINLSVFSNFQAPIWNSYVIIVINVKRSSTGGKNHCMGKYDKCLILNCGRGPAQEG